MNDAVKKLLGTGLSGGYGSNKYGKINRAGFDLDSSDYAGPEGKYHDEWAAHQNGGGQELIKTSDGKLWTRVYGGGCPDSKTLSKLGITEKDVSEKIMFYLKNVGQKSRFDSDFDSNNGDWAYSYKVIENIKEIPVTVGREEIRYKGSLVFVHFLINTPVD